MSTDQAVPSQLVKQNNDPNIDTSNVVTNFAERKHIRISSDRALDDALFTWNHEHTCAVMLGIRKAKDLLPYYVLLLQEKRRRQGKSNKIGKPL